LDAMLAINRTADGPALLPERVRVQEDVWRLRRGLEFYVDFETVTDLNDDFTKIPVRGGQTRIFMIGCGHEEDGKWTFSCFIADSLELDAEARIIEAWLEH